MDFGTKLAQAIKREDGIIVSRLLSITDPQLVELGNSQVEAVVANEVRRGLGGSLSLGDTGQLWVEIAVAHWRVAVQVTYTQNLQSAYMAQNALLVAINRAADKTDNWILPVMFLVAKELRQLSIMADIQGKKSSGSALKVSKTTSANLEEATRSINRSFTLCLNDRNISSEQSRKWGVYFFVGELFKIYFKLNKRALAKSVLKVLQNMQQQLPTFESFPKSHAVTFLYYTGVLHFIDENYQLAESKLTMALEMCYTSSKKNREYILMYLIPAQLLTKRLTPSSQLWEQFSSLKVMYKPVLDAVMSGNLKQFDDELLLRRRLYVKKYIYLAMEKIRVLAQIRLFRKVYVLQGSSSRIATPVFCKALQFSLTSKSEELENTTENTTEKETKKDSEEATEKGEEGGEEQEEPKDTGYSREEVEGFLAQLIYSGQMKGYISRDRQTVVLSNKDAFPKVHHDSKSTETGITNITIT